MNKYCVRFLTRDFVDGRREDENEVARYTSNTMIPIPRIGETVVLEDNFGVYKVSDIETAYPFQDSEEYDFDVCVILQIAD